MTETVSRISLHTLEQGSGPLTLVFLHYFGGSAQEWLGVMSQLSDQYRCIAIDLRGHGGSDSPATGYTVDDMADDVTDILHQYEVQDFVLVGHSMSGKVALALASRQPTGLQSLLLVSPSPPVPEPIPDKERQKLLTGHGQRSAAEQTLKNITEVAVSEAVRKQIIADDLRTGKSAWDAWLLAGSKEDISDRMAAVTIPVHIIVGSEDRALPPDVQPRLTLPYLPAATLEICRGAGHLLPWEVPYDLANFISKKLVVNVSN
ncbi:alpha/beta fold hydrolase [Spirosoma utsteinense]|uniref:Pimeloyl-ACP methyl ester carboxylesterase n=1 Tax=Spirosoma utsteinense TaxID=2585773 RepID=A0ABR6W0Y4_9BACT|nr:alpha/beta hydrolase [Spirosoma utsteinense]MBC3783652.1 pimeloyl-ACP methyl ester carboxylesterase [Spirosoma utsteinense]MBC3790205.1 pimeloyl-ACP methyl ester carboxylesterase [Spirosoma utsteinense]